MLQCLEGEVGVADVCDILSSFFFWDRRCHWLAKAQHSNGLTDKPPSRTLWSNQMVILLSMVATMTSSLSEGAWTVQCAGSLCASGATKVYLPHILGQRSRTVW